MRFSLGKGTALLLSVVLSLSGCQAEGRTTETDSQTDQKKEEWENAETSPLGKYPELVTYTLGQMKGTNNSNLPADQTYEDNAYTRYLKKTLNLNYSRNSI